MTGQEVSIRYFSCSGQEGQRSHVQSLGIHMRESNRKPTGRVRLAVAGHGSNWHPTCRKGFLQCNLFNVSVAVNDFLLLHIPMKKYKKWHIDEYRQNSPAACGHARLATRRLQSWSNSLCTILSCSSQMRWKLSRDSGNAFHRWCCLQIWTWSPFHSTGAQTVASTY